MSEPETIKKVNKGIKNLSEEEINNIIASCGNDQQKMLNLCKDLLKNSSNADMKSLPNRHINGDMSAADDKERVTDSIKRKAKELNVVNWQPKGFGGLNNLNNEINLNIKPPKGANMSTNDEMFDFSDFSSKIQKCKQPFSRRMKFEKQSSAPSDKSKNQALEMNTTENIFGSIDNDGVDSH